MDFLIIVDFICGKPIQGPWKVYTFEDLSRIPQLPHPSSSSQKAATTAAAHTHQDHHRRSLKLSSTLPTTITTATTSKEPSKVDEGPIFYRGILRIEGDLAEPVADAAGQLHLADTFLATYGLGKGVAWVNGFNLGWYWPTMGPQMTLYVPGPVLKPGDNDILILEVEKVERGDAVETVRVEFVDEPDFYGPVLAYGRDQGGKKEKDGARGGVRGRHWGGRGRVIPSTANGVVEVV